ncbi:MAG: molybdate ABC transporter substrate-binding protein [Bacillota bacterium]|nr:molybdate ABC transporter substrate-binding protein [Bacillota bacterium]MDI7249106.1 molybdate ABC transporter substrate-binding protein [Bacillota bacterium]
MAVAILAVGCTTAAQDELTVSAAASLKGALTEVAHLYESRRPGVTVHLNFGSSGSLAEQIEQGAPVDVFVSAAGREMDALERAGLIDPATRRDLLSNRIVLVVAAGSGEPVRGWEDLAGPAVRWLAMGTPETVPCGQYAKEVLDHLGLWGRVQGKLVFAKDVVQVVSYVETGNADAGIVFLTDSRDPALQVVAQAPPGSHCPVAYPAGVVRSSRHAPLGREFLSFLAGPEAMAVFSRYGFVVPGEGK